MGWKAFQDHFNIDGHIVQINEGNLCIGNSYISQMVTINMTTGKITPSEIESNFLLKYYPQVLQATQQELLKLFETKDHFSKSIPVYSYSDGEIVVSYCEKLDWPNITHDGTLMHGNIFFAEKKDAIAKAKSSIELSVERYTERKLETEKLLAQIDADLKKHKSFKVKIEHDYPTESGATAL